MRNLIHHNHKKAKYLKINPTKAMKDFNQKSLIKEIINDTKNGKREHAYQLGELILLKYPHNIKQNTN